LRKARGKKRDRASQLLGIIKTRSGGEGRLFSLMKREGTTGLESNGPGQEEGRSVPVEREGEVRPALCPRGRAELP